MKKIILLSIFCLVACQAKKINKYEGPGTFQEFAQARYQCAQEITNSINATIRVQTGNAVPRYALPRCDLFSACLASKGYIKNQEGKFNAAEVPIDCSNY